MSEGERGVREVESKFWCKFLGFGRNRMRGRKSNLKRMGERETERERERRGKGILRSLEEKRREIERERH